MTERRRVSQMEMERAALLAGTLDTNDQPALAEAMVRVIEYTVLSSVPSSRMNRLDWEILLESQGKWPNPDCRAETAIALEYRHLCECGARHLYDEGGTC